MSTPEREPVTPGRRTTFAQARGTEGRPLIVMADVAKAAGVSKQTVSRVLNENPNVRRETRERVLAAMREMEYRPNPAARALATAETRTIGVIIFDVVNYGPAMVLQGIGQAAQEKGYVTSIELMRAPDRRSAREAADRLTSHAVDGLITIAPNHDMAGALLELPHRVPMVAVDGSLDPQIPVVTVDEIGGARHATEHLLQLGHRTVHHLAGPRKSLAAEGRTAGWREALESWGAPVPEALVGDWDAGSGYAHGRTLAKDPAVTAVLCGNDQMALGLLRAMDEAGRRAPRDISVIGFDDIPAAAHLIPPLSSVRPDFTETGRRCIDVLLDQLRPDRDEVVMETIVPTELVIRRSSGPAPSR